MFLHEGLVRDAIAVVEESPIEALIERVAAGAVESHPRWVIDTCRKLAETIMDQGNSKYCAEAISWLARARDAYLAEGREQEWEVYLRELIDRHQRKYKLRPMLESLSE